MKSNKSNLNPRKKQNRKKQTNNIVGFERPFPSSKILNLVNTSDGAMQATAASFAVIESRLMSLAQQGFAGGTGVFVTTNTGLIDASAYALGRALKFKFEASVVSIEGANIDAMTLIVSDTQPSTTITTYALAKAASINYLHTPIRKVAVASGNTAFQLSTSVTPRGIINDPSVDNDRDFVCTLNPAAAVSTQELWAAFIVTGVSAATLLTLGLDLSVTITTQYKAYSRLPGV